MSINYFNCSSDMCVYKFGYTFATIFLVLQYENVQCESKFSKISITQVTKTLFGNDDILKNITVPHIDLDTGKQEFGCFRGCFDNVNIYGLDAFEVTKFYFNIKKLEVNVLVSQLNMTGYYNLDGMLNFPMGNTPIHVFGKGDMKIVIGSTMASMTLTLKLKAGHVIVDKLLVSVNVTTMNVKLRNLMGGGILEQIFNEYFSVLGPVVFDYYKNDIIENLKDPLIREINKFLDSFFEYSPLGDNENFLNLKITETLLSLTSSRTKVQRDSTIWWLE